jgi:hypothetical protein
MSRIRIGSQWETPEGRVHEVVKHKGRSVQWANLSSLHCERHWENAKRFVLRRTQIKETR